MLLGIGLVVKRFIGCTMFYLEACAANAGAHACANADPVATHGLCADGNVQTGSKNVAAVTRVGILH